MSRQGWDTTSEGRDGKPRGVHVALDADPLCLGMLAPISIELGFETHLICAPGTTRSPTFERHVYRRDGSVDRQKLEPTALSGRVGDQTPATSLAAARRADLLLITASTSAGLTERAEAILAVAAAAEPGTETVFLSSDAMATADDGLIANLAANGIQAPPAIFDRLCTRPPARGEEMPSRVVATHELGTLILPDQDGLLRTRLGAAEEVHFADSQRFAALGDQKLWMVDGCHLAIALRARHRNRETTLSDFVNHSARVKQLGQMLDAVGAAMQIAHGVQVDVAQALDRERMAMQLPNFIQEVLQDFKRADLVRFIERFGESIGRPAVIAAETNVPLEPFRSIARTLTVMLSDGHHYEDLLTLDPADVSEDADEAAVAAYRRALSGWYKQDWIDAATRDIRARLRYQRAELARRGKLG